MSRKRTAEPRFIQPDTKYKSAIVTKFVTRLMHNGKKLLGAKILYDAMDILGNKVGKDPLEVFLKSSQFFIRFIKFI